MDKKQHRKTPSTHGRLSRPGLQRRGSSHTHSRSSSTKHPANSNKNVGIAYAKNEADEGGMSGLPQFCATCEREIVTPGSLVLYCSAACRKNDTTSSASIQNALSPPTSIPSAASYFDYPEPEIVEPRSPTAARPASIAFSDASTLEGSSQTDDSDDSADASQSEAARYLAQFHSQSYSGERPRPRRPRSNRLSSATDGMPSLSHTPSSSIGTAASLDRPLPRKHETLTGPVPRKSTDLVIPSLPDYTTSQSRHLVEDASVESGTSAVTAVRVGEEGKQSYQRRNVSSHYQTGGSLKQLFHNRDKPSAAKEA